MTVYLKIILLLFLLFNITFVSYANDDETSSKSVWGENIFVESRTVDVHIRRLRKNLNQYGPDYIRTVRANGYSIDENNLSSPDEEEENC